MYVLIDIIGDEDQSHLSKGILEFLEGKLCVEVQFIRLKVDPKSLQLLSGDIEKLVELSSLVSKPRNRFHKDNRGVFSVLSSVQSERIFKDSASRLAVNTLSVASSEQLSFKENDANFLSNFIELLQRINSETRAVLFSLEELPSRSTDWKFDVVHLENRELVQEYLLTRIGRDVFNFALRVNERDSNLFVKKLSEREKASTYGQDLLESEYNDWFRQEFGSLATASAFLRCCSNPLCGIHPPKEGDVAEQHLLPVSMQIAVGVTRMCRRMSTWTLEGDPFECTVILVQDTPKTFLNEYDDLFRSLVELDSPCPFNFDFEDEVRQYAEMAQGIPLMLVVSAKNGKMSHIAASKVENYSESSHLYYQKIASHKSIVFRIRPPAKVDIFTGEGLVLSYDGFQWVEDPFKELRDISKSHFTRIPDKQSNTVVEASQLLLDKSQSSIFALVNDIDRQKALELTGESLRPTVTWPAQTRLRIHDLTPNALCAILHLDGAHLIDQEGEVFAVARRIRARQEARHRISISKKQFDNLNKIPHNLPATSFLQVCDDGDFEHFADLIFPSRVSPSWISGWQKLKTFESEIIQAIEACVTEHLSKKTVFKFKDKMNSITINELKRKIENIDLKSYSMLINKKLSLILDVSPEHKDKIEIVSKILEGNNHALGRPSGEWFLDKEVSKRSIGEKPFSNIPGIAISIEDQVRPRVVILEKKFHDVCKHPELPVGLLQELYHWHRFGKDSVSGSSGTGTRAAKELSSQLANSTVVKISASGKVKVFE